MELSAPGESSRLVETRRGVGGGVRAEKVKRGGARDFGWRLVGDLRADGFWLGLLVGDLLRANGFSWGLVGDLLRA